MKQEAIAKQLEEIKVLLKKKDDKPLSFKEACAYLGFAPSYLYKLTYRKVIPHYKPTGKMLFFSKCELDEWIFSKSKVKSEKSNEMQNSEEEEEESEADSSTSLRVTKAIARG